MAVGRDLCEIGNMIDSMNLIYVDIFYVSRFMV